MKKRLFIAIPLPDDTRKALIKFQKKIKKINLRWTKEENLHFTLVFIGWIHEEKIETIKKSIEKAVQNFSPFLLKLDKIVLGPDEKRARMIWAVGETTFELKELRKKLAFELRNNNIFFENSHSLKLHITLARAKGKELRGVKIDEKIDLIFQAEKIFLMESELKPEGAEYRILAEFKLNLKS